MNQIEICERAIAKIEKRLAALQVVRESWAALALIAQSSRDDTTAELDLGSASVEDSGAVASASSRKSR